MGIRPALTKASRPGLLAVDSSAGGLRTARAGMSQPVTAPSCLLWSSAPVRRDPVKDTLPEPPYHVC